MRAVAGGGRDEVEVACRAPQQLVSRAMAAGFSLAPPAAQPAPSGHSLRGKLRLSWAPVRAHLPCLQSLIRCDSRPLCPACHALPCSAPPFPARSGLSRSAAWAVPAMTFGARVCARSQCRQVRRQGALSPALCVQAALDERIFRSVRHWGWPLEARRVQIGVLLTF